MESFNTIYGEQTVGITEFLTSAKEGCIEINCTVKHRYSDFIVNEIDLDGNIVWFDSEINNIEKWRSSNLRNTLPEELQKEIL